VPRRRSATRSPSTACESPPRSASPKSSSREDVPRRRPVRDVRRDLGRAQLRRRHDRPARRVRGLRRDGARRRRAQGRGAGLAQHDLALSPELPCGDALWSQRARSLVIEDRRTLMRLSRSGAAPPDRRCRAGPRKLLEVVALHPKHPPYPRGRELAFQDQSLRAVWWVTPRRSATVRSARRPRAPRRRRAPTLLRGGQRADSRRRRRSRSARLKVGSRLARELNAVKVRRRRPQRGRPAECVVQGAAGDDPQDRCG
jgi:hypothetical protein